MRVLARLRLERPRDPTCTVPLATPNAAARMPPTHNSTPVTGKGSAMAVKATKATPKKKTGSKAIRKAAAKKIALAKKPAAKV